MEVRTIDAHMNLWFTHGKESIDVVQIKYELFNNSSRNVNYYV